MRLHTGDQAKEGKKEVKEPQERATAMTSVARGAWVSIKRSNVYASCAERMIVTRLILNFQ